MAEVPTTLALLGDIHAEDATLEAALSFIEERGVDRVLAVGDLADGRGSLDHTCELLQAAGAIVVAGNHDRWLLAGQMREFSGAHQLSRLRPETVAYLRSLPRMVEVATPLGLALLCHGLGPHDMAAVGPDDSGYALDSNFELQALLSCGSYRFVFNGHSHRAMVRRIGPLTLVNAGTFLREFEPGFVLVDFNCAVATLMEFHSLSDIRQGRQFTLA